RQRPSRRVWSIIASSSSVTSAALPARLVDHGLELVELGGREGATLEVEEGGDGLGRRAAEEGVDDVGEGGGAGARAIARGRVDVGGAVLAVADVALVLEHADERAHGRVAGRVGQVVEDL